MSSSFEWDDLALPHIRSYTTLSQHCPFMTPMRSLILQHISAMNREMTVMSILRKLKIREKQRRCQEDTIILMYKESE
jgi:hypothetical protein